MIMVIHSVSALHMYSIINQSINQSINTRIGAFV